MRKAISVDNIRKEVLPYAKMLMEFDYRQEMAWLREVFKKAQSPIMFCHNDLQEGITYVYLSYVCILRTMSGVQMQKGSLNYQLVAVVNAYLLHCCSFIKCTYFDNLNTL